VGTQHQIEAAQDLAINHLYHFVRAMWSVVEPSRKFETNWHIEAMCWEIEKMGDGLTDGTTDRLTINVPPGSMKSLAVSVFRPSWKTLRNPGLVSVYLAHTEGLSKRDAQKYRDIVKSPRYRSLVARHVKNLCRELRELEPEARERRRLEIGAYNNLIPSTFGKTRRQAEPVFDKYVQRPLEGSSARNTHRDSSTPAVPSLIWSIRKDQDQLLNMGTTLRGARIAQPIKAGLTGKRGDDLVIDDPHDVADAIEGSAETIAKRMDERVTRVDQVASTRLNDQRYGKHSFTLIMQRVHVLDLAGREIERTREAMAYWKALAAFERHRDEAEAKARSEAEAAEAKAEEGAPGAPGAEESGTAYERAYADALRRHMGDAQEPPKPKHADGYRRSRVVTIPMRAVDPRKLTKRDDPIPYEWDPRWSVPVHAEGAAAEAEAEEGTALAVVAAAAAADVRAALDGWYTPEGGLPSELRQRQEAWARAELGLVTNALGDMVPVDTAPAYYLTYDGPRGLGALMDPGRMPEYTVRSLEARLEDQAEAQLQQNPRPTKGAMFDKPLKNCRKYFEHPAVIAARCDLLFSVDASFGSEKTTASKVALTLWGRPLDNNDAGLNPKDMYFLDRLAQRMTFLDTLAALAGWMEKWPTVRLKLVEAKANGPAIIEVLNQHFAGVVPFDPGRSSKEERASVMAPYMDSGDIWVPAGHYNDTTIARNPHTPWWWGEGAAQEEFATFPKGRSDDTVDSAANAVIYMTSGRMGSRGYSLQYLVDEDQENFLPGETEGPAFMGLAGFLGRRPVGWLKG